MAPRDDFAEQLAEQMRGEAQRRGIDPTVVQEQDVHVKRENATFRIKWKDVDISMPAPSMDAVDSWFAENGKVIAGSVLTLAGVVVGGAIAIATGKSPGSNKT